MEHPMSDPTRDRVAENQAQLTLGGNVLIVDPAGPLVEFSDYARLKYKSECQTEGINAFDNKLREAEALNARLKALTAEMDKTINASQAECRRLKAEIERLRIAGSESEPRFVLLSDYQHLKAERDNLKADVERLTKAGDELGEWFMDIHPSKQKWNAAKERKIDKPLKKPTNLNPKADQS